MSYYDNIKDYSARGIDYDLSGCLEYNPQGFSDGDIDRVLAVDEGEKDERDWHWVLVLKDGHYIYLTGGCDYTGWDCRSGASHQVANTPEDAAMLATEEDGVRANLLRQLSEGKASTWRETKDAEFGLRE